MRDCAAMLGLVSNTDRAWFDHLAGLAGPRGGRLDEVNFWRPKDQNALRIIGPGAPFFLRLKRPTYAIAGFGFFAHWQRVPFREAWSLFGVKNGAPTFEAFRKSITRLRGSDPAAAGALPVGCIVLRDVTFLPAESWLPWGDAEGWSRNIVNDSSCDLRSGPGLLLAQLLQSLHAAAPPELAAEDFRLLDADERRWSEQAAAVRDGQGTFRSRLLQAYDSRCALTGERVVPVLEAAHIQRYLGPGSNHIQNGLLLRADLHSLYDAGYVTITPDLRLKVSERVQSEYGNGKEYYRMEREGCVLRPPADPAQRPSRDALAWHTETVFS